jgi:hypothetical protein
MLSAVVSHWPRRRRTAGRPTSGCKVARVRWGSMVVVPLDLPHVPGIVLPRLTVERVRAPGVQTVVEPLVVIAQVAVIPLF